MRVLIVTISDYVNYGNRLQNYALEQLLNMTGSDVRSGLEVETKEQCIACTNHRLIRCVKRLIPVPIYGILRKRKKWQPAEQHKNRGDAFKNFSNRYLHMLKPVFVGKEKHVKYRILTRYDYYIAGSDQVWNPSFAGRDYHFLTFAPPEKRIAFAASFGVEELEPNVAERYARLLKDFKYISVRERSGAKLVKQLTGKDVDVVLDPTLLLPREEWEKIVKRPAIQLPEHYVLAFFLGDEPEGAMESFASGKDIPVIHMNREEYQKLYVLDPAEFLYVVKYADYVLTDSFHGTVFSIKFEREFYVFHRKQQGMENMFIRISSLLERFKLEDREQERDAVCETDPVSAERWKRIREELEAEREKTMKKMCEVMGI